MALVFLNSVDHMHSVSNLFRSEQGVYIFPCICFLVKIVGFLYVCLLKLSCKLGY